MHDIHTLESRNLQTLRAEVEGRRNLVFENDVTEESKLFAVAMDTGNIASKPKPSSYTSEREDDSS